MRYTASDIPDPETGASSMRREIADVFPAVYDFAASQVFKPDFIAQQSIFHLHGQHTGLVVLNTESEVEQFGCGRWRLRNVVPKVKPRKRSTARGKKTES